MEQEKILFVPLGGAESVGASSYFVRIANRNIILDAGIGFTGPGWFYPAFDELIHMQILESMGQIDQIYITHGHLDHCGGIFELLKICPNARVFMTYPTKVLVEQQLRKNPGIFGSGNTVESVLAAQALLSRIETLSFLQPRQYEGFKATLFPAGHIPGAAMVYFESASRSFLYTGDYSIDRTPLTNACLIPEGIHPDIVLLCALRARQPHAILSSGAVCQFLKRIERELDAGRSVSCKCAQLTKGVEFLKILSESRLRDIPVVIDEKLFASIQAIEQTGLPILKENHILSGNPKSRQKHIYLNDDGSVLTPDEVPVEIQFTLHETFEDMCSLIRKLNAAQTILVHVGKRNGDSDVKSRMLKDPDCTSHIWYSQKGVLYTL